MIRSKFLLAAIGIALLAIATRTPAVVHPLPIDDENTYSVVGNEIVDGGKLYLDAVDRKPPLLFWTYAAVFKLAGKYNWKALHLVAIGWTLGTMAGLYAIGRRLFDPATGLIAALFYGVFQPWGTSKNLALNGELLMNLPIVWGWFLGLRRSRSLTCPAPLFAGALLGTAFLLKQPAAIAAVPLGLYLLFSNRGPDGIPSLKTGIARAALLTVGFFSIIGLTTLILFKQGTLGDAFYWVFTDHAIPHVFWTRAFLHTLAFVSACLPLLLGTILATQDHGKVWREKKSERAALLGLLAASVIGAAAGARFYPHYYIQLLPPLVLLAAPHYARLWAEKTAAPFWLLRSRVTQAWLVLIVIGFFIVHCLELSRNNKPSDAGVYLLNHSAPGDRIFVWGQDSNQYLDARRRPACRYIATFPLTGFVFGGAVPGLNTRNRILPEAWANLEQDFGKHPPVYIVENTSGRDKDYPIADFPILARLVATQYEPVARTKNWVIYRRDENTR